MKIYANFAIKRVIQDDDMIIIEILSHYVTAPLYRTRSTKFDEILPSLKDGQMQGISEM